MYACEERKWGEIVVRIWADLTPHQWECFRIALMEAETEQIVQGVVFENSGVTNEVLTELKATGVKIVQFPIVIQTKTEMIVSIVVSERDYLSEMINYLQLYERESGVFKETLTAYDREFRNTEQALEGLKKALDIIMPAHLGLTNVFTFNPWESLNNKTWGEVSSMTWDDLRIWNEVS